MKTEQPTWVYVGNGNLRLWDGEKWTDHYRPANTPRSSAVTPRVMPTRAAPAEELDEPRGRSSRLVTWALAAAAAVVAGVLVLGYIRGG